MGNVNLGLDDRSARLISGRDVWSEITRLLSGQTRIQAAISYVGSDADQYLPLKGPASIVVNAGEDALTSGRTDPTLLLRWARRGIRVYSLSSLHAKVILAEGDPAFVLIGSANAAWSSANRLEEAVLLADERDTVDEARAAVARWKQLAGEPLTQEWLQQAVLRARPAAPVPAASASPAVGTPSALASRRRPEFGSVAPVEPQMQPEPAELQVQLEPGTPFEPAEPQVQPESAAQPESQVQRESAAQPESAAPLEPAEPTQPQVQPEPVESAESVEPQVQPEPVEPPVEPELAAGADSKTQPDPHPVAPLRPVTWPRPKYIYLALLSRDGIASPTALEQLQALRSEFRAPRAEDDRPTLEVQLLWWDQPAKITGKHRSYREGWHVVPISVPASGRPAVLSAVDAPGRILHSFTDYLASPTRTYYFLLTHTAGPSTNFRKLRETLAAVGEKPSYDHAYMMQHKVDALLDLWPQIDYTD